MPEYIDETPRNCIFVCGPDAFMKADMPQMLFRAMDVNRQWRDIHIATPQRGPIGRQMPGKIVLQPAIPPEFVVVLRAADLIPIWNISIDDGNTANHDAHQAHVIDVRKLVVEPEKHFIRRDPG